jgi:periplasmic protein TonB
MTADAIQPPYVSDDDPLGRIIDVGSRSARTGILIGLLCALIIHGAGAREAYLLTTGLGEWASSLRLAIHEHLWTNYEVEVLNPPPPPAAEEKTEEPVKAPRPPAPAKAAPNEPPPAAAQAGKVLTREAAPDEPVDLTGNSFVTGNADTYAGGVTASTGTADRAVRDPNATGDGVPGGKGKAKQDVAEDAPDMSTAPTLPPGRNWQCAFPPEADTDQIDFQIVPILVTVGPDGSAKSVKIISDPGHGFGRAARECALRQRFTPALDRQGRAVAGTTPPINVKFTR